MTSKQDFQMTAEELERFKESMKNEEFKKLFFDYMNEISDPNNKKLYEEELAKLEGEKGYKVRYVKPSAEFCIKTWLIKSATSPESGSASERELSSSIREEEKEKQKCFINVCSSPEIDKPAQKNVIATGGNWDIPYSLANGRTDVDHDHKECVVYDVVFHPYAFEKSKSSPAFKTLLAKTAMEGLVKQFKLVFSKKDGYKVLVNLKSKGAPLMTMIREQDDTLKAPRGEETSLEFIEKLASSMSSNTPSVPKAAEKNQDIIQPIKHKLEIPSFKIIHQNTFNDYQKFTGEKNKQFGARPDCLAIRINLPRVASASVIDVDLGEKTLDLFVPEMYKLHLDLPFPVKESESSAKFDKSTRVLAITVPVIPAPIIEMEPKDDIPLEKEDVNENESELKGSSLIHDMTQEPGKEEVNEDQSELKGSPLIHDMAQKEANGSENVLNHTVQSCTEQKHESISDFVDEFNEMKLENQSEADMKNNDSQVDDLSFKLANSAIEDEVYNIQPPFQATQTTSSISFIIPMFGVDSSSVKTSPSQDKTTFSSFKIDFKNNDGTLLYTLHLEFPQKAFKYEVSVTPINICILFLKREEGLWKNVIIKQKDGEFEEMTLILPETIPEITNKDVIGSTSANKNEVLIVEAKQKPDLVVIEAKPSSTDSTPTKTSASSATTSFLESKKPKFVNSALFELD